ncbi:MAG TPA: hypothetical protein VJ757_07555 [Pseudonocardiaceae bacterium]|nr:hypothetical protein [Pseudonocardiaceae bacterium]
MVSAGLLWSTTRTDGLPLGDRACLAAAKGIPEGVAITADQAWFGSDLEVAVQLIR